VTVPIVVRLEGTNAEEAQKLIDEFNKQSKDLNLIVNRDFD
jgi:succinyl-CoA synthetase beta subunit